MSGRGAAPSRIRLDLAIAKANWRGNPSNPKGDSCWARTRKNSFAKERNSFWPHSNRCSEPKIRDGICRGDRPSRDRLMSGDEHL
jgi:hypothetical protein